MISLFGAASVVVTDVYMVKPDAPFDVTTGGFGTEITKLSDITGGTKFVIGNGTNAKYFYTNNENENANVANVPSDSYFYFTLEPYTGDDVDGAYWIKITNAAGDGYPRGSDGTSNYYLNAVFSYADVVISGTKDGWGGNKKDALWYVTYNPEKGFSFRNVYRSENNKSSWLAIDKYFATDQQYLKLYKSIEFTSTTMYPANDEIFALANATGYDPETGILENGGWTFETPVDLSNWAYLIITVENTSRTTDTYIRITDNDGNYVQQNQYDPGNQPQMYFGTWNNHNAACISMDYLKKDKGLNISKIESLSFSGQALKISSVYLTNYKNTKLGPSRGRYVKYVVGDEVRNYDAEEVGKFGTICLPYKASFAGAEVYSIASKDGNSISLTKVNGLLEAGKPYFYKASDVTGNEEGKHNVNFFRADFERYDAATPVISNGLIGTFTETTAPDGANYWILSGNKLYDTEGCTGEDAVTVGANKAYINTSLIVNAPSASRSAFIMFDEATGIKAVQGNDVTVKQEGIFNLNGQRLNQLKKGLNIVNGKKVMVK